MVPITPHARDLGLVPVGGGLASRLIYESAKVVKTGSIGPDHGWLSPAQSVRPVAMPYLELNA